MCAKLTGVTANPDDDEVVTWWGLVIEGYSATHDRLFAEIEERFGLKPAQFDVLVRLVRSPDYRQPMTKLAKEAALSSGGFTKVADRLEREGLIHRVPSPTDRRVTYAALTEHGIDVADKSRTACAEILRRILMENLGSEAVRTLAENMRTLRERNGA